MMHSQTTYDYAESQQWQAVRLPYRGGELSMVVLLPRDTTNPARLLAARVLTAADRRLTPRPVELFLPKWNLETTAQLKPVLVALGMRSTFGTGGFSALTPDPEFFVSQVTQQANITVGEKGTKAAAATVVTAESGGAAPPPDLVKSKATHPFAADAETLTEVGVRAGCRRRQRPRSGFRSATYCSRVRRRRRRFGLVDDNAAGLPWPYAADSAS